MTLACVDIKLFITVANTTLQVKSLWCHLRHAADAFCLPKKTPLASVTKPMMLSQKPQREAIDTWNLKSTSYSSMVYTSNPITTVYWKKPHTIVRVDIVKWQVLEPPRRQTSGPVCESFHTGPTEMGRCILTMSSTISWTAGLLNWTEVRERVSWALAFISQLSWLQMQWEQLPRTPAILPFPQWLHPQTGRLVSQQSSLLPGGLSDGTQTLREANRLQL